MTIDVISPVILVPLPASTAHEGTRTRIAKLHFHHPFLQTQNTLSDPT